MVAKQIELEMSEVTYDSPKYNRIFPSKMSTSSFLELYILFLFQNKKEYYGKEIMDEIGSW